MTNLQWWANAVREDPVNLPAHYRSGNIECIDYIKDMMSPEAYRGYLLGNVTKYLHRYRFKGKPQEDLKKAMWYLTQLQQEVSNNED
jgi:hypothetical protein